MSKLQKRGSGFAGRKQLRTQPQRDDGWVSRVVSPQSIQIPNKLTFTQREVVNYVNQVGTQAWQDGLRVGYAMQILNFHSSNIAHRINTIARVAIGVRGLPPAARGEILRSYLSGVDQPEDDALLVALDDLDKAIKDYGPTINRFGPQAFNQELFQDLLNAVKAVKIGIHEVLKLADPANGIYPDNGEALYTAIEQYGVDELLDLGQRILDNMPNLGNRPRDEKTDVFRQLKKQYAHLGKGTKAAHAIRDHLVNLENPSSAEREARQHAMSYDRIEQFEIYLKNMRG